jgi:hypothetical protein
MKRKHLVWYITVPVVILLLGGVLTAILAYQGTYLGEQQSPDGMYSLHYYKSFNPFVMAWSMPGDAACTPEWVRLYSKKGEKLNELYSSSCMREMNPLWDENEVVLPDGQTIWKLP